MNKSLKRPIKCFSYVGFCLVNHKRVYVSFIQDGSTSWKLRSYSSFCWKQSVKRSIRFEGIRASVAASPRKLESSKHGMQKSSEVVRVGVLGASGYTGSEVLGLLQLSFGLLFQFFIIFYFS